MKISKRIISLLMAALLVFGLPLSAFASDGGEIRISTAEDWKSFVKNCKLDTWSQGKTVTLTADLDLCWIQIWIWAAILRRCLCSAVLLTVMDTASIWGLIRQRLLIQGYFVM